MSAVKLNVMSDEAKKANEEMEALEKRLKELRQGEAKKKLTVRVFEYVNGKGVRCAGVGIRGLGVREHQFFPQQILRLVADTPEADAARKAIREFIEANKGLMTWGE